MPDFTLETGDGTRLADPSATQIREALMGLHGADNPFAILDDPDGRFVQAYGSHIDGFALEYCPARGASARQVAPSLVSLDVAMRAFEALCAGEKRPLFDYAWQAAEHFSRVEQESRQTKPWASGWLFGAGSVLVVLAGQSRSDSLLKTALVLVSVYFLGTAAEGIRAGGIRSKRRWNDRGEHPIPFWVLIGVSAILGVGMLIALFFSREVLALL